MLDTLTLLKMDLVKLVSSVQNLKLAMATDGNFNPPNVEVDAWLASAPLWPSLWT